MLSPSLVILSEAKNPFHSALRVDSAKHPCVCMKANPESFTALRTKCFDCVFHQPAETVSKSETTFWSVRPLTLSVASDRHAFAHRFAPSTRAIPSAVEDDEDDWFQSP